MAQSLEEAKKLMIEINGTVSKMDEAVRAKAFDILAGIAFGGKVIPPALSGATGGNSSSQHEASTGDGASKPADVSRLEEMVEKFDHDKPADAVKLLVAFLYSQYGVYPINLDEIRELGREVGVIVPKRLDMTLKNAKSNGKSLYEPKGNGCYQLTVHGQRYMKDTYSVQMGKKPRPTEGSE